MAFVLHFVGAFLPRNASERLLLHEILDQFLVFLEFILKEMELGSEFEVFIFEVISGFLILLVFIVELFLFLVDASCFESGAALQVES